MGVSLSGKTDNQNIVKVLTCVTVLSYESHGQVFKIIING